MQNVEIGSTLKASQGGVSLAQAYRAVLILSDDKEPLIQIEQQFTSGAWGGCGQWALSTLTDNGVIDGLSIDYGQRWQIDSGLSEALSEALIYVDCPQCIPSPEARAILDNASIGSAEDNAPIGSEYQSSEQRLEAKVHPHVVVVARIDCGENDTYHYQDISIADAKEKTIDTLNAEILENWDFADMDDVIDNDLVYIDHCLTSESPITIA